MLTRDRRYRASIQKEVEAMQSATGDAGGANLLQSEDLEAQCLQQNGIDLLMDPE